MCKPGKEAQTDLAQTDLNALMFCAGVFTTF